MGDEVRRTQGGNNNAYGHDDPTSWFDWTDVERNADLHRFTRGLIAIRRRIRTVLDVAPDAGLLDLLRDASLEWSGVHVGQPDFGDNSHSIALTLRADAGALHLVFNAWWEPLDFDLPRPDVETAGWRRIIDTSLPSPDDIVEEIAEAAAVESATYPVGPRSVVLLVAQQTSSGGSGATT